MKRKLDLPSRSSSSDDVLTIYKLIYAMMEGNNTKLINTRENGMELKGS